jgi:TATA element modulatory factor
MQEAEAKAAAAEEKERSVSERLSQCLSRITVLETQVCVLISGDTKIMLVLGFSDLNFRFTIK